MITYKIAVVMACYNRRKTTIQCLDSLLGQALPKGVSLNVIVVDDASPDGTSEAIKKYYPDVLLLQGDGNLYWNGAMFIALEEALKETYDFHLWLNDDVQLYPNGLQLLLQTHGEILSSTGNHSIIVGTFCDPETGRRSYGGLKRRSCWHPLRFKPVFTAGTARPCHTFEGNGVLVPAAAFRKIGVIEAGFSGSQNTGDTDYGLRATEAGIALYSSPAYIGKCKPNTAVAPWTMPGLSFKQRWDIITGPKGLQAGNYFTYARRHGGIFWPLFWLFPILKALPGLFFPRLFYKSPSPARHLR